MTPPPRRKTTTVKGVTEQFEKLSIPAAATTQGDAVWTAIWTDLEKIRAEWNEAKAAWKKEYPNNGKKPDTG